MDGVVRNLNFAFLGLLASVVACIAIRPQGLWANDGLSYYGVFESTLIPYILGFLVFGLFVFRAADRLSGKPEAAPLMWLLRACIVPLFGLAVKPHNIQPFERVHLTFGTLLFLLEVVIGLWLLWVSRDVWVALSIGLLLAGAVASLLYLPLNRGYLLEGQIFFQLAFWLLVVRAVRLVGWG